MGGKFCWKTRQTWENLSGFSVSFSLNQSIDNQADQSRTGGPPCDPAEKKNPFWCTVEAVTHKEKKSEWIKHILLG